MAIIFQPAKLVLALNPLESIAQFQGLRFFLPHPTSPECPSRPTCREPGRSCRRRPLQNSTSLTSIGSLTAATRILQQPFVAFAPYWPLQCPKNCLSSSAA